MIPLRFERRTYCLEGSCSIQLSYGTIGSRKNSYKKSLPSSKLFYLFLGALVGIARFELATSCSQSRRDNRTTLYPVFHLIVVLLFRGEGGIRTPGTLIEYDSLANCWFQPLTHLSECFRDIRQIACEIGCKSTNFF